MIIASYIYIAVRVSIPVLLGITGAIFNEKAGNTNLGIEGMMYMGAFAGFYTAVATNSVILALIAACLFGAFGALIYAFATVTLRTNQVVAGLSLTIFGQGIARFLGNTLSGAKGESVRIPDAVTQKVNWKILGLKDIPFLGRALFGYDMIIYLSIVLVVIAYFYINKSKTGLNLRAVGENPAAADAAGINVSLYKYVHICIGGAFCGLAGAYIGVVYLTTWGNNMIAGKGWIAVALVIFASWNPLKAIYGSLLFGFTSLIALRFQDSPISPYLLEMLPYLLTVIILIITSVKMKKENQQPASCGVNYFREER